MNRYKAHFINHVVSFVLFKNALPIYVTFTEDNNSGEKNMGFKAFLVPHLFR
jgi:hypothetical protein